MTTIVLLYLLYRIMILKYWYFCMKMERIQMQMMI